MEYAVFRTPDISVQIRILGSEPLTRNPGPYPALFVSDLQNAINFFVCFVLCLFLFEGTFASLFKDKKSQKKSLNSRNPGFSSCFCLLMEGSGSGSRRPKIIRILRIRIRNTAYKCGPKLSDTSIWWCFFMDISSGTQRTHCTMLTSVCVSWSWTESRHGHARISTWLVLLELSDGGYGWIQF